MSKVYCRSCRKRHRVTYPSDDTGFVSTQPMTRCHGMWWFVDRHERTGNFVPITGATRMTRGVK